MSAKNGAILAIAENFRFVDGWKYGAEEVKKLGRVTSFVVRMCTMMETGNKYYQTSWRAKPQYQGGFLLDGGVHFTAALRLLLGPDNAVQSAIADTTLITEHLPPVDTINAVLKLKSGSVGSFVISMGATMKAFEYYIAC